MVLAFSAQDNSTCLCLQFSDKYFNRSLFSSNSFKIVAKDWEDLEGLVDDSAVSVPHVAL